MQDEASRSDVDNKQLESRAAELRVAISDLGHEIDSEKTKKAAALGIGVFFALLTIIAANDLVIGKAGLWLAVGITDSQLMLLAIAFGIITLFAFLYAARLEHRRDRTRETKLEEMMQELENIQAREEAFKS